MKKSEQRFNLVDEAWIPISGVGLASLRQVFSDSNYRALGGNPVQKIALTKFLLAICQAAATPEDDEAWAAIGEQGMAERALAYLEGKHDLFWLYGERPFLQMPSIVAAAVQSFGAVQPSISTGNTTVLFGSQVEVELSDAEKALLVLQLMGFGLGGKKTDNSIVLSPGYREKQNDKGRPSTGKPGTSVGFLGFLHNFLTGESLQQSLWLNLFSRDQIARIAVLTEGIGITPWESMPDGEDDAVARRLRFSLMGRLIPVSRFIQITEEGLHYSEGISHPGYKEGVVDPSVAVDYTAKIPKVLWSDPERRPWRSLPSLLAFLSKGAKGYDCYHLLFGIPRARSSVNMIGVWSGGLRLSSNAGEQYASGTDDFIESQFTCDTKFLEETWFDQLKSEMEGLDSIAKITYSATRNYFKTQQADADEQAAQASSLFWQLCERRFQDLVNACVDYRAAKEYRKVFATYVHKAYDSLCPRDTARQIDAWAKNRPNLAIYLA